MTMSKRVLTATITIVLILQGATALAEPSNREFSQATVGGGCFWCIEAVFDEVAGVEKAESGYAGGSVEQPDYGAVCDGVTGHAEVVQVTFDPTVISYEEVLLIFFGVHDPTTKDRQGADVGTQYRSIILAADATQETAATELVARLDTEGVYSRPMVTQVERLERFWPAEDYHQDYYRRNQAQGYCQAVIAPKLAKFRKEFAAKMKR